MASLDTDALVAQVERVKAGSASVITLLEQARTALNNEFAGDAASQAKINDVMNTLVGVGDQLAAAVVAEPPPPAMP
jgi:hypothetical protein